MILLRAVVCTPLITRPSFAKDEVTFSGPSSNSLDAEPIRSNLFHLYLMTVCLELLVVGFYWFPCCASIDLSLLYWWSNFMGQLWRLIWGTTSFLSQPLHHLLSNWRDWLLDWIHLGLSSRKLSCLCDRCTWWLLWWWLPPCHLTLTLPPGVCRAWSCPLLLAELEDLGLVLHMIYKYFRLFYLT